MKALIQNTRVIDVQETEYEVHESLSWVDCDSSVEIGWTYDGTSFETNIPTRTAEDLLNDLRRSRNKLLAETDWVITMHKEKGTNIPAAWKTYRQALRDITDTYTSLDDVVWPEKPE